MKTQGSGGRVKGYKCDDIHNHKADRPNKECEHRQNRYEDGKYDASQSTGQENDVCFPQNQPLVCQIIVHASERFGMGGVLFMYSANGHNGGDEGGCYIQGGYASQNQNLEQTQSAHNNITAAGGEIFAVCIPKVLQNNTVGKGADSGKNTTQQIYARSGFLEAIYGQNTGDDIGDHQPKQEPKPFDHMCGSLVGILLRLSLCL